MPGGFIATSVPATYWLADVGSRALRATLTLSRSAARVRPQAVRRGRPPRMAASMSITRDLNDPPPIGSDDKWIVKDGYMRPRADTTGKLKRPWPPKAAASADAPYHPGVSGAGGHQPDGGADRRRKRKLRQEMVEVSGDALRPPG